MRAMGPRSDISSSQVNLDPGFPIATRGDLFGVNLGQERYCAGNMLIYVIVHSLYLELCTKSGTNRTCMYIYIYMCLYVRLYTDDVSQYMESYTKYICVYEIVHRTYFRDGNCVQNLTCLYIHTSKCINFM